MLLIALSGGTVAERVSIADQLVASGKGGLAAFAMLSPAAEREDARAQILRDALEGTASSRIRGLVIVHCLAEAEAMVVRRYGGSVWHVYGVPSQMVHIRLNDPIVTDQPKGFRHVLTPIEALSERLRTLPAASRKALSVA